MLTARKPADAHLARARLDDAGSDPVVANQLSALSRDGYARAAGGILVQVPEEEAADARTLLGLSAPASQ